MLTDVLHAAVLCSKRAPGFASLLHHPFRGPLFEVDCVMTTEPDLADCGVPVIAHPIRSFYDDRRAALRDLDVRRDYDAATAAILRHLGIDTVILLGYLYVVTDALLDAFPGRVLNVHDADLALRRPDGGPRYPGLHSTRNAIVAGERETRSSVHRVTPELDGGPVIVRSEPFPVAPFVHDAVQGGHSDIVRAYAYAHREWMIRSSWGALVVNALEILAAEEGRIPAGFQPACEIVP